MTVEILWNELFLCEGLYFSMSDGELLGNDERRK